jgi:galactose mutarotase-like enzyme
VRLDRDSELVRLEEHGLPNHGLRPSGLEWEVSQNGGDSLRATAAFDGGRLEAFPYPHTLAVDVAVADDGVTLETTLTPTSATPVPIAFGYHPYLTVPGAPRAEWEVDMPVDRRLLLDENLIPTGEAEMPAFRSGALGDRSLDDGYELPEHPRPFTVSGGGRTLGVEFLEGYTHAQAYAPAGQDLICFEPMTAPANALISHEGLRLAAPGEPFHAAFRITVDG